MNGEFFIRFSVEDLRARRWLFSFFYSFYQYNWFQRSGLPCLCQWFSHSAIFFSAIGLCNIVLGEMQRVVFSPITIFGSYVYVCMYVTLVDHTKTVWDKSDTGSCLLAFEWCIYSWPWPILKVMPVDKVSQGSGMGRPYLLTNAPPPLPARPRTLAANPRTLAAKHRSITAKLRAMAAKLRAPIAQSWSPAVKKLDIAFAWYASLNTFTL